MKESGFSPSTLTTGTESHIQGTAWQKTKGGNRNRGKGREWHHHTASGERNRQQPEKQSERHENCIPLIDYALIASIFPCVRGDLFFCATQLTSSIIALCSHSFPSALLLFGRAANVNCCTVLTVLLCMLRITLSLQQLLHEITGCLLSLHSCDSPDSLCEG